jgi:diguanylate cyclase (GGDEF)-like protein/PAS domain S-box-containing protein
VIDPSGPADTEVVELRELTAADEVPCGFATITPEGRLVSVNRALLRWLATDHLGPGARLGDLLTPASARRVEASVLPVLRMQGAVRGVTLDLRGGDGSPMPTIVSATLDRDGPDQGRLIRLMFIQARERLEYERATQEGRQRAERMAARFSRLSELATALAAATSVEEMRDIVEQQAPAAVGASGCVVELHPCLRRASPDPGEVPVEDVALDLRHAAGDDESADDPLGPPLAGGHEERSWGDIVVPFGAGGLISGTARFTFSGPEPPEPDAIDLLSTLGRQVGQALDRARLGDELRMARDRYAAILDAATEQAIVMFDAAGDIKLFNAGAERMLGYRAEEVLGRSLLWLMVPDELAERGAALAGEPGATSGRDHGIEAVTVRPAGGTPETRRWTWVTADGTERQVEFTVTPMPGASPPTSFIGIAADVTSRARAEEALALSEEQNRLAFEGAPIGMVVADIRTNPSRVRHVNQALCDMLKAEPAELIGRSVVDLLDVDLAGGWAHEPDAAANRRERQVVRRDGESVWVLVTATVVGGDTDRAFALLQVEDVTARRHVEARLTYLAFHDPVTGLANRALVLDHLDHALARAARHRSCAAVLYLDVDNFKDVNDSLGHAAGDNVMSQIGSRLLACLRSADVAGRLGGDEFAVVCEDLGDPEEAEAAVKAIVARVRDALSTDLFVGDRRLRMSVSIGIAISRPESSPEDLLGEADAAMYRAKRLRDRSWQLASGDVKERALRQIDLEADLRRAVEDDATKGELFLHYQPCVDLATGRVAAVEALLRWDHPVRGLLGPGDFLDVAEDRQLMIPLGALVLEKACAQARAWEEQWGAEAPEMWVNISARQLEWRRFPVQVATVIRRTGVSPDRLCLEITERQLVVDDANVRESLRRLAALGVRVSIDDFGTGYAGLDYLRRLPLDILKLDASYFAQLDADSTTTKLAAGIAQIGRSLGLDVAAEGIETPAQLELARSLGCTMAQGFLLARPEPAASIDPPELSASVARMLAPAPSGAARP